MAATKREKAVHDHVHVYVHVEVDVDGSRQAKIPSRRARIFGLVSVRLRVLRASVVKERLTMSWRSAE